MSSSRTSTEHLAVARWAACFALASLAACASTDGGSDEVDWDGLAARVVLDTWTVEPQGSSSDTAGRVFTDAELTEEGGRIVTSEAAEVLPAFLRDAETSISARWTGEGPIVAEDLDRLRLVRLRRVLTFEDPARARACFPDLPSQAFVTIPGEGVEVVSGEVLFRLVSSADGSAIRVGLDQVFVRESALPVPRVLPLDDPLPVVVSLTLKYVHAGEQVNKTVVFAETLGGGEEARGTAAKLSDWVPVAPGPHPHSIQIGAIAREELQGFTRVVRDTGLSIFDLAQYLSAAGGL